MYKNAFNSIEQQKQPNLKETGGWLRHLTDEVTRVAAFVIRVMHTEVIYIHANSQSSRMLQGHGVPATRTYGTEKAKSHSHSRKELDRIL